MPATSSREAPVAPGVRPSGPAGPSSDLGARTRVAVLTGGGDRPYALGLGACLIEQGVRCDFIGSDELEDPSLRRSPLLRFLNLRGDQRTDVPFATKMIRVLKYYARLIAYATTSKARVFHILWHNKFQTFDRTLLTGYYRLLGKRVVLTAHNVNAGKRDGNDSWLNRFSLRCYYGMADAIFVHTARMRQELITDFKVPEKKAIVIPFGINSTVPDTALSHAEARKMVGLKEGQKGVLFFGNIAPYKGLEFLIEAFAALVKTDPEMRLIIVGRPKNCADYWAGIRRQIEELKLQPYLIERIEFVPDEDTEIYFKAADVLVLPYTHIFQSGVLFLGFNFGLPVIATDVGSLKEDIDEGETGYVCRPRDSADLGVALARYFNSDLHRQLPSRRSGIRDRSRERYSWTRVGEITKQIYLESLK